MAELTDAVIDAALSGQYGARKRTARRSRAL